MKLKLLALMIASFSVFSAAAFSADFDVANGVYATDGDSHYENGEIVVSRWADGFNLFAKLVRGQHLYDTEAYLEPVGGGHYRGSGTITIRYSESFACVHRFGVSAIHRDGAIFLRENTPQVIPYNPNGPCTGAGRYVWFNHPEPYYLIVEGE